MSFFVPCELAPKYGVHIDICTIKLDVSLNLLRKLTFNRLINIMTSIIWIRYIFIVCVYTSFPMNIEMHLIKYNIFERFFFMT